MSYQTSANSNSFLMGSCRVSIPSSSGGYVHLGAARGVKMTEAWEKIQIDVDNTAPVQLGAKKHTVTVEGSFLELDFHKLANLRGWIDTWDSTIYTFTSGGNIDITPQAIYLTHTSPLVSTEYIVTTIYYAAVTEGLSIPFPADDATEVAEIPFKLKGVCQSTRTVGQQLYNIVDTRSSVYSTTYYSTSI